MRGSDEAADDGVGVWRSIAQYVFAPIKITRGQFFDLLMPFRHSTHIRRHVAAVVISRVRLVAALFALLVPLGIPIDAVVFPHQPFMGMVVLRVVSSVVFVGLVLAGGNLQSGRRAGATLMTLLTVPPLFYLASIRILQGVSLSDSAALINHLYALLPNVVLAGLAVFPLTALEVAVFAAPAFVFMIAGIEMGGSPLTLQEHGPTLWLMVLVMGVAMFSGMSQLHYITTLVNRAMVDALTGAYTRRSGSETLDLMFRLSAMQNIPLTVAFFDLDHFKGINDGFGHEEGDKALRNIAEALRLGLRRGDVLVRWGGEEFLAILNNTDVEGARVVIERLREVGYGLRPDGVPLTASVGVAERRLDGAQDWPQLVEMADQRMYLAKRTGRDRVIFPGGPEHSGLFDEAGRQ